MNALASTVYQRITHRLPVESIHTKNELIIIGSSRSLKRKTESNQNNDTFTIAKRIRCDQIQVENERTIKNCEPILTNGIRLFDVIYTCCHEGDAHIYAINYRGNEKTLVHLRHILAVQYQDHDGIIVIFMTTHQEPIIETNVQQWSLDIGREFHSSYVGTSVISDDSVHFHILEDIQTLEISESKSALVDHLARLVTP
ncbi:unnamed protein product [Didymodactylos carnosus]|uniref:Uncharacterized protein n=1 Tax=Didymodactylos carnosus TaxID=1234261 RepID=A0A8S2PFC2_9BILA|nr:unnamed protein product [Didymodactylos carnosus]CAF4052312.1 unnamed protein product [Didymodactylos carnosus]